MNIYLSQTSSNSVPEGFQAVSIFLDASIKSLLEWKEQIAIASDWREKGKKLFWCLDFNLLEFTSISDQTVEILRLAVAHFEREVWEEFKNSTVGVCLYQGSCALDDNHVAVLDQLAGSLPDEAEPFLLLDASSLSNPLETFYALSKEKFPYFTLAVKGGVDLTISEFGWETTVGKRGLIGSQIRLTEVRDPTVGICIPTKDATEDLEKVVQDLQASVITFRMIPEALLTTEWQDLEYVIVDSSTVTGFGMRRLMGFCAAGGTIVTLGKPLNVPLEIQAKEWFEKKNLLRDIPRAE